MSDNIREGKYDNKLPFVSRKKDPEAYKEYNQETSRLLDLFIDDLEKEYDTSKLKGKDKIFAYAWEQGHAYGFSEVVIHYEEIAALVVEVMLANLPDKK
ncbi:MAG: hypothetical protein WC503_00880 [Candidatus Shapirobacteria bacterium]